MNIRTRILSIFLPFFILFLLSITLPLYFYWASPCINPVNDQLANEDLQYVRLLFLTISGISICFFAALLSFIANSLSRPLKKLNQIALAIAAGDYKNETTVKGPTEIEELAQTLHTMNACLIEETLRIQENSFLRERMHGEHECFLLMQQYMLQKVVADFHHPSICMHLIATGSFPLQKGLLLEATHLSKLVVFTLLEAPEPGLAALFQLNKLIHTTFSSSQAFITCQLQTDTLEFSFTAQHLLPPLIWSCHLQTFVNAPSPVYVQEGDFIFIANSALLTHFETVGQIKVWFSRVLRHFAQDGIEAIYTMLTNELNFFIQREQIKESIQIICLQISHKK